MGLFTKKKKSEPSQTTETQTTENPTKPTRKYFEVFGDTLAELDFFKTLTLCLVAITIFLLSALRVSLKKTPIVIRVDQIGHAQVAEDAKSSLNVSPAEISNFTQYFLQYFTAWNFYTYEEDFSRALKMATADCKEKLNKHIEQNKIFQKIKDEQYKVKLSITEISVTKDSPNFVNLKARGTREVFSYKSPDMRREEIFENEITLAKTERTYTTPWGLLVESWQESLFKK